MRTTRIVASCLIMLALGCETPDHEPDDVARDLPEGLEDAACPASTQIARVHPSLPGCPSVQGWSRESLFAEVGGGALKNYCRYEWLGDPGNVETAALAAKPGILEFAPDCEVVFEQGSDALWAALDPDITDLFHYAIGWASPSDLVLSSSESSRSPVLVAVIDSVPEPAPTNPRSEHGELMVGIVEDIACPDSGASCKVDVVRELGLPRYDGGLIDPVNGGYYASQADIAEAIYRVVEGWRTTNWGTQTPKLILNFSLGWDAEMFGDMTTPVRPAVRAVHDALEYASCFGVISIAAAGNEGYSCMTAPLLPGGFETLPAPDASRCAALGAPTPPTGAAYRPLVYSVGGLTHEYAPMPGTRDAGMPRLAAAATHAVSAGDSTVLTGTSVSSAVASGTAALVWSYNPQLTPAQVMSMVYQSGTGLAFSADYHLPNAVNTTVRAIDACAALEAACNLAGSSCPAVPFAAPLPCVSAPAPLTLDDLFDSIALLEPSPQHDLTPTFGEMETCAAECSPVVAYQESSLLGSACPASFDPLLPFTLPQPTEVACPNCSFDLTTNLVYASLDPSYDSEVVEDVSISIYDGSTTTYLRQGAIPLKPEEITRIELDSSLVPSVVVSASISIKFASQLRPVVDDLLVN